MGSSLSGRYLLSFSRQSPVLELPHSSSVHPARPRCSPSVGPPVGIPPQPKNGIFGNEHKIGQPATPLDVAGSLAHGC